MTIKGCMNIENVVYIIEQYSAIKKTKIMIFSGKWMKVEMS